MITSVSMAKNIIVREIKLIISKKFNWKSEPNNRVNKPSIKDIVTIFSYFISYIIKNLIKQGLQPSTRYREADMISHISDYE